MLRGVPRAPVVRHALPKGPERVPVGCGLVAGDVQRLRLVPDRRDHSTGGCAHAHTQLAVSWMSLMHACVSILLCTFSLHPLKALHGRQEPEPYRSPQHDQQRTHDDDIDAEQHELAAQAGAHALQAVLGGSVRAQEGRRKFASN